MTIYTMAFDISEMWKTFQELIVLDIVNGISDNVVKIFTSFQSELGEISTLLGQTPQEFNSNIFSLIENVSKTAVLPVAVIILSLVMSHELISMIIDKNNMADFPVSDFLKWIFKTTIAILFLDKSFDFTCAIFELAQEVVNNTTEIAKEVTLNFNEVIGSFLTDVNGIGAVGAEGKANWLLLFMIYLLTGVLRIGMLALTVVIHLMVVRRMFEVYMMISMCPIPFATLGNREFGQIGQNYIKSMFALAFQSFFYILSIGIFGVLLQGVAFDNSGDILQGLSLAIGYCGLLCLTFAKIGSYSNRVFGVS